MDVILIGDILKKITSIYLFNNKLTRTSFIEDPLMPDLSHIQTLINVFQTNSRIIITLDNILTEQIGGSDAVKAAAETVKAAAVKAATDAAGPAAGTIANAATDAAGPATDAADARAANGTADKGEGNGGDGEGNKKLSESEKKMNDVSAAAGENDEENPFFKLLSVITKLLLYPLLFIFLVIFPYIYVSVKSFSKLRKLYKKNVVTM